MKIFDYESPRDYVRDVIKHKPQGGRGEIAKISKFLGVHSTLISLILSGKRDFTQEQAFDLCGYLELTDLETEYFMTLLQHHRAGNHRLKGFVKIKLQGLRQESLKLSSHTGDFKVLKEGDKAQFYSSWIYSAIRMHCSLEEKGQTLESIVERFKVRRNDAVEYTNFLVKTRLLNLTNGRFTLGAQRTFVPFGSPFLVRHHLNWRLKSLQKADHLGADELMVTSPISVSKKDFAKLKMMINDLISGASKIVKDSKPDDVACLNVDLFWLD